MTDAGARPDWDAYFLEICKAVALRSDCTRRRVGALVVRDHRIASTGYTGAPAGEPGCLEGACPRGRHYPADEYADGLTACGCGKAWPCPDSAEPASGYDTGPGACISVHAEVNALLYASRADTENGTMYCTDEPCNGCWKAIRGAGITRLVTPYVIRRRSWNVLHPGEGAELPPAITWLVEWRADAGTVPG